MSNKKNRKQQDTAPVVNAETVSTEKSESSAVADIFEAALQSRLTDLRQQAAVDSLLRMVPTYRSGTVGEFLDEVSSHEELNSATRNMALADFANLYATKRGNAQSIQSGGGRTRINDETKRALATLILDVLRGAPSGLGRSQIAEQIAPAAIEPFGISPDELADKLRQPLAELADSGKLRKIGEKRLMVYQVA